MTDQEKLEHIIRVLNVETPEEVVPEALLCDIPEWDSMGAINMIDLINEHFGKVLRYKDLKCLARVSDLMEVMR